MEVNGWDGGDSVHPQALRVGGQGLAVRGVVAGHVGDDGDLASGLGHHILQDQLALLHALVDALAGGAAHIQALHALADQIAGELPHLGGADGAQIVIACVECRDDALIFAEIAHKSITPI